MNNNQKETSLERDELQAVLLYEKEDGELRNHPLFQKLN